MHNWLPVAANFLLLLFTPVAAFFLKVRIEASVRASVERQNEVLRSELRANEERLKSELRAKEAEFSSTLDKVLNRVGTRQALIDERRLKAVEAIWTSLKIARQFKGIASTLGILNLPAVSAESLRNPRMREFAAAFLTSDPQEQLRNHDGFLERPFISDPAWAYFSAYYTIIITSVAHMKVLSIGAKLDEIIDTEPVSKILIAALPHRTDYIEKYGFTAFHHLLEELEEKVLEELRKALAGQEADEADVRRASEVRSMLEEHRSLKEKVELPPSLAPELSR